MERLTLEDIKNIRHTYVITSRLGGKQMAAKIFNELSEYKNIEEYIGIDLITLFNALVNGVWVKNEVGQIYHTNIYLHDLILSSYSSKNNFCFITPNNILLLFDRIKQDWALTREELENE